MAKEKTVYVCSNCGQDSPKWVGKCPSCGEWNTYVEEIVRKEPVNRRPVSGIETQKPKPLALADIVADDEPRINMHDDELNRVLGGGLVPGSLVLIGGEPGIGKSTLVMQTVLHMPEKKILYVSGEESARQLKLRADRLSSISSDCLIVCETSLEQIYVHIKNTNPDLVIIDSIQTISTESIESSPGSIAQVRECSASILRFAKETHTPVLLIGHINKEGSIAGPKVLEHIVDTVLQFEGDQHYMYRILRSIKNRFGSTAELGIYEMRQDGLRQVSNPSELLLSQDHEGMSGVAIASAIEGIRPFLIETQALVSSAVYGNPQRSATGFDLRRMNMLLAVLEKRVGFKLAQKDVFLNIAGGLKVNDPAIDLSVISAILSSNMDAAIEPEVCMAGEIGLSGEIRPVNRIEQRIGEAEKLGFKRFLLPKYNLQGIDTQKLKIELVPVRKVEEREANKQNEVVAAQLASVFSLSAEDFSKIILAYEPVWAIGTGKTASPEQAQEIHAFIRSIVANKYGKEIADNTSILYGGSCKPSNAKELFANPDVDGGLIGGAALKVSDFKGIIDAFN